MVGWMIGKKCMDAWIDCLLNTACHLSNQTLHVIHLFFFPSERLKEINHKRILASQMI